MRNLTFFNIALVDHSLDMPIVNNDFASCEIYFFGCISDWSCIHMNLIYVLFHQLGAPEA